MSKSEREIIILEADFARASAKAFSAAAKKTQADGHSNVVAQGGVIYRVDPDGSKEAIKRIDPPIPIKRGTKYRINK